MVSLLLSSAEESDPESLPDPEPDPESEEPECLLLLELLDEELSLLEESWRTQTSQRHAAMQESMWVEIL